MINKLYKCLIIVGMSLVFGNTLPERIVVIGAHSRYVVTSNNSLRNELTKLPEGIYDFSALPHKIKQALSVTFQVMINRFTELASWRAVAKQLLQKYGDSIDNILGFLGYLQLRDDMRIKVCHKDHANAVELSILDWHCISTRSPYRGNAASLALFHEMPQIRRGFELMLNRNDSISFCLTGMTIFDAYLTDRIIENWHNFGALGSPRDFGVYEYEHRKVILTLTELLNFLNAYVPQSPCKTLVSLKQNQELFFAENRRNLPYVIQFDTYNPDPNDVLFFTGKKSFLEVLTMLVKYIDNSSFKMN